MSTSRLLLDTHARQGTHQDGAWKEGAVTYAEGPSRYHGPESTSSAQSRELQGRSRLVYMGARPTLPHQARPDDATDPAAGLSNGWTGTESRDASGGEVHRTSDAGMDPMYDLLQQLRSTQHGISGRNGNGGVSSPGGAPLAPQEGQTPEVIRRSRKSRGEQMPEGSPGVLHPKERTLVGERLAALRSRREELKGALLGIVNFPPPPAQPFLGTGASQPGRSSPQAVRRCLQLPNGDVAPMQGGAGAAQGLARASREDMAGRETGAADSSLLGELLQRLLHPSDSADAEGGEPAAHGHAEVSARGSAVGGDDGGVRTSRGLFAAGAGGVRSVLGKVLSSGGLLRPGDLLETGGAAEALPGHLAGGGGGQEGAGQEGEGGASGHWDGLRGCIESLRVAMAKLDGAQGREHGDGEKRTGRKGVATVSARGSLELSGIMDASARSWSLRSSGGVPTGASSHEAASHSFMFQCICILFIY